jgi:hypothetical protein
MKSYHPNNIEQITEENAPKYSGISMARAAIYLIFLTTMAVAAMGCGGKSKSAPYLPPAQVSEESGANPYALDIMKQKLMALGVPEADIMTRDEGTFMANGHPIPNADLVYVHPTNKTMVFAYLGGYNALNPSGTPTDDKFKGDEVMAMSDVPGTEPHEIPESTQAGLEATIELLHNQ